MRGSSRHDLNGTRHGLPDIVHTPAYKQAFNLYLRKGVSIELSLRAAQEHPTRLPALRRVILDRHARWLAMTP